MIRIIRLFYYTLFALTPLVMSSATTEMFEFNKIMGIYAIAIIIGALYSLHYLINRPTIFFPKVLYLFGIFFVLMGISTYFSIDPHTSIYGYYGRWNGGLVSIVAYVSLLFVFIQTFDRDHLKKLLLVSVGTSALVILWALPGWFGYDLSCLLFTGNLTNSCWTAQFAPHIRMFSTLGQPNWLGAYLAIHLFIGMYFLYESLKSKLLHRYLILAYLILNLFALYATKSKSSWYGVALALSIGLILFFSFKIRKNIRSVSIIGSIATLVLVTGVILTFGSSLFTQKVPEHLDVTDSFIIRTYVWQGAINLWKQYPVFGSGPETFAYAYFFTKPIEHSRTSEWDFVYNKAHNEFLHYLATTGIVGFMGYVGIIGGTFHLFSSTVSQLLRNRKKWFEHVTEDFFGICLLLSYISILATNFFGFSTSTIQLFFYLIPGMIIVYSKKKCHAELVSASQLSGFRIKSSTVRLRPNRSGMTMIVLFTIMLLSYVGRIYYADRLYARAQSERAAEDYQSASHSLVQALKLKYEHVYEDKLSTYMAHFAFISSFAEDDSSLVTNMINQSKLYNAKALDHSFKNVQYWRSKARNYYLYYQITHNIQDLITAADTMKYTTKLAPNDAQGYYMTALFNSVLFSETKDVIYQKEALSFVKQALMLRPQYVEASELLGGIEASPSSRE
ncbi:MAG: O-antigen ligase family protein [bacterium]|nr:O-antigen ligase family protein [bacterium]